MGAKKLAAIEEKKQIRHLDIPGGTLEYFFARKNVRRLNLRILANGSICVSAPLKMQQREVDTFLYSKIDWIQKQSAEIGERFQTAPAHTPEECIALFSAISKKIFPLFFSLLEGNVPALRVREMKTRWGVCHVQKRSITLNTRLADRPIEAIEYVILHEYVHFIHSDHQKGFHAEMKRLMPDYKERRRLLR